MINRQPSSFSAAFERPQSILIAILSRRTAKSTSIAILSFRPIEQHRLFHPAHSVGLRQGPGSGQLHAPKTTIPHSTNTTSTSSGELNTRVNPPLSTLPAPLEVPERAPDQSLFSYLYKSGRAYLGFYKTGIKNIWTNHKLTRSVKASLRTKSPSNNSDKDASSTPQKIDLPYDGRVTRGEFQLLLRNRHDITRIPAFLLLFAIFGEWLPLIAIFFTAIVPNTCRIPSQIQKELEKAESRRHKAALERKTAMAVAAKSGVDTVPEKKRIEEGVEPALNQDPKALGQVPDPKSKTSLLYFSRHFSLHSPRWEGVSIAPPSFMLRRRLRQHLKYLAEDDALIRRDGSVRDLTDEEVAVACRQRGIDVLRRGKGELRKELDTWVKGDEAKKVEL